MKLVNMYKTYFAVSKSLLNLILTIVLQIVAIEAWRDGNKTFSISLALWRIHTPLQPPHPPYIAHSAHQLGSNLRFGWQLFTLMTTFLNFDGDWVILTDRNVQAPYSICECTMVYHCVPRCSRLPLWLQVWHIGCVRRSLTKETTINLLILVKLPYSLQQSMMT